MLRPRVKAARPVRSFRESYIVAIFYPFGQFCEIDVSPLSLQKQPKTAPSLFQRGVEYGKYDSIILSLIIYYVINHYMV